MPFNTLSVATAVTPSVIETYFSHFLNRGPLRQKPTAHISYHEGLRLIRQFLEYSSKHSVEDLQAFTAQWVPVPAWVRTQDCEIPPQFLRRAANVLRKQLGADGLGKVGGEQWWTWRRSESPLHAEWIEMKKDYNERKRAGEKCDRVILYIHGGAYYFGSVDEHRYQMQRHARKLKARVLAPKYRLAPQFPFPCGLYDCIATYFYLLEHFEPSQILFAGDSAGGGMVLSVLVTLRDQGCPLPAGTILLSPWVDLTHSFPSVAGDGVGDYIPPHGFHHKPSMAWPPPPQTEGEIKARERTFTQPMEQPFEVVELPTTEVDGMESGGVSAKPSRDNLRETVAEAVATKTEVPVNSIPGLGKTLELTFDEKVVQIREQFQLYARNELLTHPLVSPVQQPSLGGLPPMLMQVGGGELLRDEQIYLAHKAANPRMYPPGPAIMNEYDPQRLVLNQYPPTDVQLQVWEDLCHVPHTLSFTRPAKYMYRSVAQFGAWALARAQHKGIEILDDAAISIISDGSEHENAREAEKPGTANDRFSSYGSIGMDGVSSTQVKLDSLGAVGKAGDELPPFKDHMIRQRVNRHGVIYPLPHRSEIACLQLDPATIGALKPGPVRKWLSKRAESEQKFAGEYKKLLKKKAKELKDGYDKMEDGEFPPATALVNRRRRGVAPEEKKKGKSWGLAMWSGWGSSHDESTIQREEKLANERAEEAATADARNESVASTRAESTAAAMAAAGFGGSLAVPKNNNADAKSKRRRSSASVLSTPWSRKDESRPRSPYRHVRDAGQTSGERYSTASPTLSPLGGGDSPASSRAPWGDLSRRSSQRSGKMTFTTRPVSVAAPSKLGNETPQSPTMPTLAPAPSMSDTGKEAVKVPGSDSTFLNPESSRPHNGTMAYPFKLRKGQLDPNARSPSPNPSTMTLDSNEQSDKESVLNGSARESVLLNPATNRSEIPAGVAVEKQGRYETSPPNPELGSKPAASVVSQASARNMESPFPGGIGIVSGRPVSFLSGNTTLKNFLPPEEDPVSPLDTPPISTSTSPEPTATTLKPQGRFEYRDSRLGNLGADGMPTSAFPVNMPPPQENGTVSGENSSSKAPTWQPKIRNPVHDPRVAQQAPPPGTTTEAVKTAPFKMRHTVEFPKVVKTPAAEPVPEVPANANGTNGAAINGDAAAEKQEVTSFNLPAVVTYVPTRAPVTPPPISDTTSPIDGTPASAPMTASPGFEFSSPPQPQQTNTNITMPLALPARPVAMRFNTDDTLDLPPPPPPPKDDQPPTPPSKEGTGSVSGSLRRKPVSTTPVSKFATGPSVGGGAISPPTMGDVSFEVSTPMDEKSVGGRPVLETFVTASEGLPLGYREGRL